MKTRSRHLKRLLQPKREKKSQPTWGERSSKNQPRRRSHRVCGRARRLAALFFFRECSKAKVLGGWRGAAAAAAAGTYCGGAAATCETPDESPAAALGQGG